MAFVVFEDTRSRTKEFISITDNKTFGLPRTFLNNHQITSMHKAVILYDEDKMKVALHFTLTEPKVGLTVRIPNEKQGGMIVARSFFDAKAIDVKKYSQRYDFEKVSLQSLGINKFGEAFVITLAEKKPAEPTPQDIGIDDFDDKPIDLSEIPF